MSSAQERPAGPAGASGAAAGTRPGYGAHRATGEVPAEYEASGAGAVAFGFTALAATLMVLSGLVGFFEGLTAILKHHFYVTLPNYTFQLSITSWGWTHMIIGAVVFFTGVCLFLDMTWARVAGVVLAVVSAIANFMFIPFYPVWSIVVIAIDLFIIWALLAPRARRAI